MYSKRPGRRGHPHRSRRFFLSPCGVLLLFTLLQWGAVCDGSPSLLSCDHVPKPVNAEVDVRDSETELHVLIDEYLFRHWFSLDPTLIPDLDPDLKGEWGQFGDRIVEWLDSHVPVQV
ncbi:MAG: hypothetical protein HRU16_05465, partial [Planctomycetes bacterium]|nr:hypothetical protein [Planctomycetota bacterium]